MVNVYVRDMKWDSVGHAALEIYGYGPKLYVSWWPAKRSIGALFGGVPARPHVVRHHRRETPAGRWWVWTPGDVATYAREINIGYSRVEWRMFMADMA